MCFFPSLGFFCENQREDNFTEMEKFWELVMEYQLNHKFGKYFFHFPKVGKNLEKQRVLFPILGNLLANFRDNNFTQMGTFWKLEMKYYVNSKFGK